MKLATNVHELPTSRKDALDQGTSYYYSGNPCLRGHLSKRQTLTSNCTECQSTAYRHKRKRRVRVYTNKTRQAARVRITRRNRESQQGASNSRQHWTMRDIKIAVTKNASNEYVVGTSEACRLLGRSCRSIERCRDKHGNRKLVEPLL